MVRRRPTALRLAMSAAAIGAAALLSGCGEDGFPANPGGLFVSSEAPRYPCPGGLPPSLDGPCVASEEAAVE